MGARGSSQGYRKARTPHLGLGNAKAQGVSQQILAHPWRGNTQKLDKLGREGKSGDGSQPSIDWLGREIWMVLGSEAEGALEKPKVSMFQPVWV